MSVSFSADVPSPEVNFSNCNAVAVLQALRLPVGNSCDGLVGRCSVVDMRRVLIRARSSALTPFTREGYVEYGKPRADAETPNVVLARPLRVASTGLDVDGLRERLDLLEMFVQQVTAAGGKEIRWS